MPMSLSVLDRVPPSVAFPDQALEANLERLDEEFEIYQATRNRDAIYRFLEAVFELILWWRHEGMAIHYSRRALWLRGHRPVPKRPEPFAAAIQCTTKVDYKTRSKWSRVLRYAAEYYSGECLTKFIKRKGGINRCAARFARRLGRTKNPH